VFRKPYTKAGSNQQEDCPSTVNQTLLSVRTPGDVPQVRMLILDRGWCFGVTAVSGGKSCHYFGGG